MHVVKSLPKHRETRMGLSEIVMTFVVECTLFILLIVGTMLLDITPVRPLLMSRIIHCWCTFDQDCIVCIISHCNNKC